METGEHTAEERPQVLAMPDYRDANPYQSALAEALDDAGVDVLTVDGAGIVAPVTGAVLSAGRPPVLHMHFLAPFMAVEDDRLESAGVAGLLSVLLGVRLLFDLLIASLLTERVVWTAHDLRSHEGQAPRTEFLLKHLFVRFVCHAVIVHCDQATDVLVETFGLPQRSVEKMRTVPHGSFLDDYPNETTREEARDALDLPADAVVVLFFGWIRRYKNVPELVDVFADIDRADARLVVAGNPRTERLARDVREAARGDDRVRLTLEFVPDDEVQTYMHAADVVALPFRTADQTLLTSGSALLAMGFGRAVVAPRLGCIGELLSGDPVPLESAELTSDGAATTASPHDAAVTDGRGAGVQRVSGGVVYDSTQELETALRTALDSDLAAMGDRNRTYAEALEWDRIAALTAAVYRGR